MKQHKTIVLLAAALVVTVIAVAAASREQKSEPSAATDTAAATKKPGSETQLTATAPSDAPAAPPGVVAAAPSAASEAQIAELSKPSGGENGGLYTVKEGTKVDAKTLQGWKTWRALACDRCHGAEQQGLVGPPLVVSLHRLTKDDFKKTITDGRPERGMPPFNTSAMVMDNWEGLYAFLKGRADGQIQAGHLYPLDNP
jgi:mono/diheme cytochrome c family protein